MGEVMTEPTPGGYTPVCGACSEAKLPSICVPHDGGQIDAYLCVDCARTISLGSLLPLIVKAIDMAMSMDADSDAPPDEKPFTIGEYWALHAFKEANNG